MLEHPRQVGHVILRDIFRRRTPLAVAAAAHVNRNHVIPRRQMRRERVEVVRVAGQPMHAYDPRRAVVAVVDIMKPKTVRADEFVRCHLLLLQNYPARLGCRGPRHFSPPRPFTGEAALSARVRAAAPALRSMPPPSPTTDAVIVANVTNRSIFSPI